MTRTLTLYCAAMLLCGCEVPVPEAPEQSDGASNPPEQVVIEPPQSPPVKEDFASVEEGLATLVQASEAGNKKQQMAAYQWLCKQGSPAVDDVAAAMNDASLPMEARRHACRVLGHLGPTATEPLIAASRSDQIALKLRAIETMPAIDPPQRAIVERLMTLLDDSNQQVQTTAIRSLKQIGPAAKASADKLLALRDNIDLSETVRQQAGDALRAVRPIRTFED